MPFSAWLLAIRLVGAVGVRWAIGLSVIPGLLAALAIVYAIRHTAAPTQRDRQPIRLRVHPVLQGQLGRLMTGITVFDVGNCAATLLICGRPNCSSRVAATITPPSSRSWSYVAYNLAATLVWSTARPPLADHSVKDGRERTGERPADGTGHAGSPR